MEKSAIFGQNHNSIPVPNRGGTGTHRQRQSGTGTNQSGVGTFHHKKGLVPVLIQVVLVPMLPAAPIFVILHC